MTSSLLVDGVKIVVNSTGTGALALGSAVPSFRGIEALINGSQYSYAIQVDGDFEWGTGTYLATSQTLTRSPIWSSNGGAPIDLSANAQVSFVALAEDLYGPSFSTAAQAAAEQALASQQQADLDAQQTGQDRAAVEAAAGNVANGNDVYGPAYASALPQGVTALSNAGVGTGSGGTPGNYQGGVSGGPSGFAWTYTVGSDGKIASYAITNKGLAAGNAAPTLSYPSGSVAGATVPVATVSVLIADQQTYWAASSNGNALLLYGNNGGSLATAPFGATQISVPATAYIDALLSQLPGGSNFTVRDENGNILIQITTSLVNHPDVNTIRAQAIASALAAATVSQNVGANKHNIVDASGNALLTIDPLFVSALLTSMQQGPAAYATLNAPKPKVVAQVPAMIMYGQSNGDGRDAVISSTALAYADMLGSNPRGTAGTTSVSGYKEVSFESPLYGCMQMLHQLWADEDGYDPLANNQRLFGAIGAQGGTNVHDLSAGGSYFPRIPAFLSEAKALYDAAPKSFAFGAMGWVHGEQDYSNGTTRSSYRAQVRALFASAQAAGLAGAGTNNLIPMLMTQVATHLSYSRTTPNIALAQLDMASDPNACLACPLWQMDYFNDGSSPDQTAHLHMANTSAKWAGAYLGLALKRWVYDGVKPKPLAPVEACAVGKSAVIVFDPGSRNLVLDNSFGVSNYGLTVADAAGNDIPVTGVIKVAKNLIQVTTGSSLLPGYKVRHAWTGNSYRGIGGIRDDQGSTLIFDPTGINKPMHNYAPIFEQTLI